ncbi:MAG: hypothetical protein KF758_17255 [Anaerolineales bacterium]|nr:hypothetical protein [Anaerolineales bacterium]MBX3038663.1 hypothetical protein [Anaerolineales bacterium]
MKYIRILLFILLMLPVYNVSAKPKENTVVTLIEVRNDSKGGIIFVFQVNDKISKSDLNNGFVQVEGGDSYGLHCNQVDDNRVQCITSKKASGKNVVVGFAGAKFWVYVPMQKTITQCYSVYDWDDSFFPSGWVKYGEYCQDFPPSDGDEIIWENPSLLPPYLYRYSSASQPSWCPSWSGLGPGYYYNYCIN